MLYTLCTTTSSSPYCLGLSCVFLLQQPFPGFSWHTKRKSTFTRDGVKERRPILTIHHTYTVDSVTLVGLNFLGRKDMSKMRTAIVTAYLEQNSRKHNKDGAVRVSMNPETKTKKDRGLKSNKTTYLVVTHLVVISNAYVRPFARVVALGISIPTRIGKLRFSAVERMVAPFASKETL